MKQKKQNCFHHESPLIDLWHSFPSIKHDSLTVISSIEYIYVHIKYIKSKSNTQNCQVENNMKMIFTMEKFKSLVVMLSKLHDHGKAASTSTKSFPLSKTIKINQMVFLHFLVGVLRVFLAEEYLKQNEFCLQHWKKSVSIVLVGLNM